MNAPSNTEGVPGKDLSAKNKALLTGASVAQDFAPLKNICGHLNAFHAYSSDPKRVVEANHYCGHLNDEVRQCILYDSDEPNARIIGIEYMITPSLYETLDPQERRLWHSHVYEVKSGMLIMPQRGLPDAAWEAAENKEMEEVVKLYGKVYHLWQVDRGDKLPVGQPQLMTSFTADGQLEESLLRDRDGRFGVSFERKREVRKHIEEPAVHEDADYTWKKTWKGEGNIARDDGV